MKWGTTNLNVIKDSYLLPFADSVINVISILPGANNIAPATVLQQGGRGRYQVAFDGYVKTYAEYQALLNDYIEKTQKTFEGANGFSMTMIIFDFKPKNMKTFSSKIEYSITLVEV